MSHVPTPSHVPAPSHVPTPSRAQSADRVRQVAVTVAAVLMLLGTLVGVGVLGTRVAESAGGSLSATATPLAPAGPAFSIWSVIYVGLFAYVVLQWLPRHATTARARATGWLAALTMVLNGAWLLITQAGWLWVSVVDIAVLALALGVLVKRLTVLPPTGGAVERLVVDGTFGLYLGWVAVATVANIAAALADSGVEPAPRTAEILAVVVLAVAAGLGVVLARVLGGRFGVAAAMAWGLTWIAVGRLTDAPSSTTTGIAALVAAVVVIVAAVLLRRPAPGGASSAGGARSAVGGPGRAVGADRT